jgi:hypothetical protein
VRKDYLDEDGKVAKAVDWFGHKLHHLVDVRHEIALTYAMSG